MKVLMVFVLIVACACAMPAPDTVSDVAHKAADVAVKMVNKAKEMIKLPDLSSLTDSSSTAKPADATTAAAAATTAKPADATTAAAATTAAPAATTAKKA